MYRYIENLPPIAYRSAAWRMYTDGLAVGFLDLETTGLSRKKDAVILGGLIRVEGDGSQTMTQLLCDDRSEEATMLAEFWAQVRDCHILVTYNGDSFDLPFLKERLLRFSIASEEELPLFLSLDLYHVFRSYCPMSSLLSDLRQKTVEDALGLTVYRRDQIDGGESVRLFEEYALLNQQCSIEEAGPHPRKEQLRETILLHNRDDLLQLTRLMKLLDKVDLHRVMSRRGFPVRCGQTLFLVERIALNKKEWRIEAASRNLSQDMDVFMPACRLVHHASDHRLTVCISVMHLQGCIVADLEALPGDYSSLARYPSYESGYLILHDGKEVAYAPMNHCIQLFLSGLPLAEQL
ncbi:MAG: ribonuclease H-like domain-containing protein [Firmicutes bacterium]|nr:ribonuclease H-like domain-containing protein [Bacillota bacterium]